MACEVLQQQTTHLVTVTRRYKEGDQKELEEDVSSVETTRYLTQESLSLSADRET